MSLNKIDLAGSKEETNGNVKIELSEGQVEWIAGGKLTLCFAEITLSSHQ